MTGDKTLLGRWGEAWTAQWMSRRGYRLVDRNWRCRFGEIDLIATNGRYICFTEVKLRKGRDFAQAREFVDHRKQERLRSAASLYLAQNPTSLQPRFDVAELYAPQGTRTRRPELCYLENAF